MALDVSMGGSTNTVLHLLAAAHEGGVDFTMADIDRLSRRVPCLCKVAPAKADVHMEDVHRAGGIFSILGELARGGLLHTDLPTPLANTFYVWLDVDYEKLDPQTDWVHVGTWGNNPDWKVHTMSVLDRKLHMAHLQGYKYTGPTPQPDFPLKQWVRITVYLHYPETGDGTVCAWQDGVPVMTGKWTQVDGPNLMRTHWGMYAASSVDHGVQYNDEIQLFSLDAPLADCNGPEPVSPYEQPGETGGDETTGGDGTTGGDETTGAAEAGESTGTTDLAGDLVGERPPRHVVRGVRLPVRVDAVRVNLLFEKRQHVVLLRLVGENEEAVQRDLVKILRLRVLHPKLVRHPVHVDALIGQHLQEPCHSLVVRLPRHHDESPRHFPVEP